MSAQCPTLFLPFNIRWRRPILEDDSEFMRYIQGVGQAEFTSPFWPAGKGGVASKVQEMPQDICITFPIDVSNSPKW